MKHLKLKLLGTFISNLILTFLSYLFFNIWMKDYDWYVSMAKTTMFFVLGEVFILWIFFGLDLLKSQNK